MRLTIHTSGKKTDLDALSEESSTGQGISSSAQKRLALPESATATCDEELAVCRSRSRPRGLNIRSLSSVVVNTEEDQHSSLIHQLYPASFEMNTSGRKVTGASMGTAHCSAVHVLLATRRHFILNQRLWIDPMPQTQRRGECCVPVRRPAMYCHRTPSTSNDLLVRLLASRLIPWQVVSRPQGRQGSLSVFLVNSRGRCIQQTS